MQEEAILNSQGVVLAVVDNIYDVGKGLHFYGKPADYLQVGTFRYDRLRIMRDHRHLMQPTRKSEKTQEILIVFKGSIEARTYDIGGSEIVDMRILKAGDLYICYWGGCGFTVLEDDTIMLEAKNGPFISDDVERELIE
jgi:hypothetical protein